MPQTTAGPFPAASDPQPGTVAGSAPHPTVQWLDFAEALRRERAMLEAAGSGGFGWLLWQTEGCIVVPRSHATNARFTDAAAASAQRGYPVQVRDTGGSAVVQGPGVLNLSLAFMAAAGVRDRIGATYRALCAPLIDALRRRGVEAANAAVPGTMCDGAYNVVVAGRKLAGTAQRWRSLGRARPGEHAVLAHLALFLDVDHAAAAAAINAFYAGLGMESRVEPQRHINWVDIPMPAAGAAVAGLVEDISRACRAFDPAAALQRGDLRPDAPPPADGTE